MFFKIHQKVSSEDTKLTCLPSLTFWSPPQLRRDKWCSMKLWQEITGIFISALLTIWWRHQVSPINRRQLFFPPTIKAQKIKTQIDERYTVKVEHVLTYRTRPVAESLWSHRPLLPETPVEADLDPPWHHHQKRSPGCAECPSHFCLWSQRVDQV